MDDARCAMCGSKVHFEAGRIACDACSLPTDCCLCPPQATEATPPRS